MFELVILSGARAGVVVPAEHGLIAGRDAGCLLEIPDPSASRQHARFDWDGVELRLTDTRSSNGTYVNERPIQSERLQDGDTIRIGNTNLKVQQRATHSPTDSHAAGATRTLAPERTIFGIGDTAEPYRTHSRPLQRADAEQGSPEARVLQHRLASMVRVSELLASARTPDELFAPVLDVLFELLPQTDRGFLLLGDSETNLRPQAVRRRRPSRDGEPPPRVSRSICRAALETRSAFIYREGDDTPIDRGHSIVDLQIRSALALPLMIGDQTLGLIVLDTRDPRRTYDQDDLELGVAVCHQVAIAMRSAQLVRAVEAETTTRNNLMRFLPPALAEQVLRGELDGGLGGRRTRATVLFADVIGFTSRSEQLGPGELVRSMNSYFNQVVPCIQRTGGSIDKFMGDAIMAVWGVPFEDAAAARSSLAAGLWMHERLASYNSGAEAPVHAGIGICTGEVVAGNIGTEERREYTVLGDTVNTAQRIECLASRDSVLCDETTWTELCGQGYGIKLPIISVRNRTRPVQTYSVRGIAEADDEIRLLLPTRVGDSPLYLIRRLADRSFVGLVTTDTELEAGELVSAAPEWPEAPLGRLMASEPLPISQDDGTSRRLHLKLEDPSLGGLLGDSPLVCTQSWEKMPRQ